MLSLFVSQHCRNTLSHSTTYSSLFVSSVLARINCTLSSNQQFRSSISSSIRKKGWTIIFVLCFLLPGYCCKVVWTSTAPRWKARVCMKRLCTARSMWSNCFWMWVILYYVLLIILVYYLCLANPYPTTQHSLRKLLSVWNSVSFCMSVCVLVLCLSACLSWWFPDLFSVFVYFFFFSLYLFYFFLIFFLFPCCLLDSLSLVINVIFCILSWIFTNVVAN